MKNKIVYFFCINQDRDPVANSVLQYLRENYLLEKTEIFCDGKPVLCYEKKDTQIMLVQMDEVLSHDYEKYLPFLNKYFADYDMAAVINWHEGNNAPSQILTVHTIGDVPSGNFANASATQVKEIFQKLEYNRAKYKLDTFTTLVEATHWSGIPYQQAPELIEKYSVPIYDIEIGSEEESWNNKIAVQVLGESLIGIECCKEKLPAIIGIGGKHFEMCFSELLKDKTLELSVGHILPNQWITNEGYINEQGKVKLEKCIQSLQENVVAIIYHDNLKGIYKETCRSVGEAQGIPCLKHKILKKNHELKNILGI